MLSGIGLCPFQYSLRELNSDALVLGGAARGAPHGEVADAVAAGAFHERQRDLDAGEMPIVDTLRHGRPLGSVAASSLQVALDFAMLPHPLELRNLTELNELLAGWKYNCVNPDAHGSGCAAATPVTISHLAMA